MRFGSNGHSGKIRKIKLSIQESSSNPDDEIVELERVGPEAAPASAPALAEVPPSTIAGKRKSKASATPATK